MASFRAILGACVAALLSVGSAGASSFTTLYNVKGSSDGASPQAALINVSGTYYGTTTTGGTPGYGTVFAINPATGTETTIYSFTGGTDGATPQAALVNVGGTLYGTTYYGGTSNEGTVFAINPTTGAETVVYRFAGGADGAAPQAELIEVGGKLYGTTSLGGTAGDSFAGNGTIFSINRATGAETVLYRFGTGSDGNRPQSGLINVGGTLYGTTPYGGSGDVDEQGGTVFSFNPATGLETVLHSFGTGSDGAYPIAALIDIGGTLYGTTVQGGSANCFCGTVFAINPTSGAETTLHSFAGGDDGFFPEAALTNVAGTLYGTTTYGGTGICTYQANNNCGTVFSVNAATGAKSVLYSFAGGIDGADPQAALLNDGKTLYGTTDVGGSASAGTVFSVDQTTGAETSLHNFTGATSLYNRGNALQNVSGTLFLSASLGGSANIGDIVEIDPSGGAATEVYAFTNDAIGAYPATALISDGSVLYGTTEGGGNTSCYGGCGTVFSLDPAKSAETPMYRFKGGKDGSDPVSALIDIDKTLYGTTAGGGQHGHGMVFAMDLATGVDTILHSFGAGGTADGEAPQAELIDAGGTLYGTTVYGGSSKCASRPKGCGTVFTVNPATAAEAVLFSFPTHKGYPRAALIDVGGTLYGTATYGGRSHGGYVFSIIPATGAEKTIHKFEAAPDGANPEAALIEVGGTLYGTTSAGGTFGKGTVFSINPAKGAEHVIYSFTGGSDGGAPTAALVSVGGTLYGTTTSGGAAQRGTVFELVP